MPAHRFFSATDRLTGATRQMVRVSLPNLNPDEIQRAAGLLRAHLGTPLRSARTFRHPELRSHQIRVKEASL